MCSFKHYNYFDTPFKGNNLVQEYYYTFVSKHLNRTKNVVDKIHLSKGTSGQTVFVFRFVYLCKCGFINLMTFTMNFMYQFNTN